MNRWRAGSQRYAALRNSISSTFFWVWNAINGLLALLIWDSTGALIGLCLANIIFYTGMYFHLIYYKTPRWMILREKPVMLQTEFSFSGLKPTQLFKPRETMTASGVIPEPNGVPVSKQAIAQQIEYAQIWLL